MRVAYETYKSAGKETYTKLVCKMAPYFSSIDPQFEDIRPGYVEASIKDRNAIHNHLGSINAGAMCTAAELVGGTLAEVSLPDGNRWIPSAMSVQYLAKAKSDLKAVADGSGIDWSVIGELIVPVTLFDVDGKKVLTAQITMNIKGPKL
jgi:acyl-coenzyme A thioesterase PaaI-like protein